MGNRLAVLGKARVTSCSACSLQSETSLVQSGGSIANEGLAMPAMAASNEHAWGARQAQDPIAGIARLGNGSGTMEGPAAGPHGRSCCDRPPGSPERPTLPASDRRANDSKRALAALASAGGGLGEAGPLACRRSRTLSPFSLAWRTAAGRGRPRARELGQRGGPGRTGTRDHAVGRGGDSGG